MFIKGLNTVGPFFVKSCKIYLPLAPVQEISIPQTEWIRYEFCIFASGAAAEREREDDEESARRVLASCISSPSAFVAKQLAHSVTVSGDGIPSHEFSIL